jgi:putative hydrolase of the HAD superfamily
MRGRPVVWSDFAGVLTPPLNHTMGVFCNRIDVPREVLEKAIQEVSADYGTRDFMKPLDTSLVTESEWLEQVTRRLPEPYAQRVPRGTIADLWFADREPNHAWIAQLLSLRQRGYFVGLLSNMMPSWDAHWRRMVPVDSLFDDVVLSFAVGLRKPEQEIYRLATERSGADPADCFFVDDQLPNVEAARACGWTAVHFTGTDDAIGRLTDALAAHGGRKGGMQ